MSLVQSHKPLGGATKSPFMTLLDTPKLSRRQLAATLAGISIIGPFSTDTYLPSLFDIGRALHASPIVVQQTLTAYIVPFAIMTLWHGAVSDALGRKRVILISMAIFALASIGCAMAWDIGSLMFFRAIQGMTAGAGMVVGRAMVRDLFDGAEAQKFMSQMALVFALGPAIGPVIGGWLDALWGWRSVFMFLALLSGGLMLWAWKTLPETLPKEKRIPFHPLTMLHNYQEVFSSKVFLLLSLALTLGFCSAYIYIISAPAFLGTMLHIANTHYVYMFGPMTVSMVSGSLLSGYLASRMKRWQILFLAGSIIVGVAVANVVFHSFFPPTLPWSLVPVVLYFLGSSLAMPILTLMALDLFPDKRGTASSCQSFAQSIGNAIATAVIAPLLWGSALHMAWGMAIMLAMALVAFLMHWALRPKTLPA